MAIKKLFKAPNDIIHANQTHLIIADLEPVPLPAGKLGVLVALMSRSEGATLDEMQVATAWQAHSIRGAISGALKKGKGIAITSTVINGARRYQIEGRV
jgi:hypothetical protein